jgi:hypothetical protein
MHEASEAHETSLSPPVGIVEFQLCVPMLGLATTDQAPPPRDSTSEALALAYAVDCHPAAVHDVGLVHDTPWRPPCCDPRLGGDVLDHLPLSRLTINGWCVVAPVFCVAPTATQSTTLAQETPDRKLSTTSWPNDGRGVTDQDPSARVSMRAVSVPPLAELVKKYPTATHEPMAGQETERRKSPLPFGALGAVLADHEP